MCKIAKKERKQQKKNKKQQLKQLVFTTEQIPEKWNNSVIVNIDKEKKDKENLSNKRRISLSSNVAKLF